MGRSSSSCQFDKTPDSGRKEQLSIDSFFASPQEKQIRRGISEEEMAILVVEEEVSRREQLKRVEAQLAARCKEEGRVWLENGSRDRFGM